MVLNVVIAFILDTFLSRMTIRRKRSKKHRLVVALGEDDDVLLDEAERLDKVVVRLTVKPDSINEFALVPPVSDLSDRNSGAEDAKQHGWGASSLQQCATLKHGSSLVSNTDVVESNHLCRLAS